MGLHRDESPRDGATFYLTAPTPYLNRPAIPIEEKNELAETVARTFEDSHRQELALEAVERDPHARRLLEELDRTQRRARENDDRLEALRERREHTPFWRRADRHDLDHFIASNAEGAQTANARVDELRDDLERHLTEPAEPPLAPRAREPLAHLERLERLERAPQLARDLPDHGLDIGP